MRGLTHLSICDTKTRKSPNDNTAKSQQINTSLTENNQTTTATEQLAKFKAMN